MNADDARIFPTITSFEDEVCFVDEPVALWNRNVFAKMLYDAGDISHDEFQIYTMWFDEFLTDVPLAGIVYINASPAVCMERIGKRARAGETIHSDYIQRCHDYHETWIRAKTCPLLELPADEDMNESPNIISMRMERITEFIRCLLSEQPTGCKTN